MRSPLLSRISALRGRVRRQLALHGLGLVVAGAALFILVAGLADWSIHLAREIRVALLVTLIGLTAFLVVRYVIAPLIVRFRDLDIALKIERRWPGLNDRLASTVQFLEMETSGEGDRADVLGSKSLREATIKQTLAETDAIDFREVIDPRPVRRAGLVAAGALAVGALVFAADPRLGSLAMKRLFQPFASNPWPQMTHLAILKAPAKVARGEPFALEVGVAKGERAPSTAKITYRYEDGEIATESLRPDNQNKFHGRKEAVEKSFTFTVAAGDDTTSERKVQVVPPPVVSDASVRLVFPDYTGLPAQKLMPGKTQLQAVIGTMVEIEARANKPLASAKLARAEGQPAFVAEIDPSGLKVSAKFEIEESGPASFTLKDTEGFSSQEKDALRFDLRAIKDEAPRVVVDEPVSDRDVTAKADVPIEITADDDFGLSVVRLVYKVSKNGSEPSAEVVIPLWAVDPTPTDPPAAPVKQKQALHRWELAPLNLQPGDLITFYADARDLYKHGKLGPNTGKSRELHLRIVTEEQALNDLVGQRREIREDLERAGGMQQQAITPVEDALRTLDQTNKLDEAKREEVKNAETIQRQLSGRITSPTDGLEKKVRKYLDDLANLKIENADGRDQMEELLGGLEKLRDNNLGPAEQNLTRAVKDGENKPGDPQSKNAAENGQQKAEPGDPAANKADAEARNGEDAGEKGKAEASDKAAASKAGASKASQAKAGESKASESKAGESKSGDADAKSEPGDAQPQPGEAQPKDSGGEAEKAQPGDAQPKDAAAPPSPSPSSKNPTKDSLREAQKNQKAIADELQKMRDSLNEFETYKGVVQDAKKILKEQEDAMKNAGDAASKPELTAKAADALTPEQKADLANVAARQSEVAKSLARLENKMDEMAERLKDADPLGAAALKDAAQESRKRGTSGKMEEAAKGIEQNQMGQAQAEQKTAQQDLKKLVDALNNRRENELARLVKELKAAEKAMADLKAKQADNLRKTAEANKMADPQARKDALQKLAKEQKQIQEQLKKQLLALRKIRADAAAQAGERADAKMAQAGEEQEEGDGDEAEMAQEEALNDLNEAEEEIADARRDAEEQLAMEQLSKIKDHLQGLADRQESMIEETNDYEKARAAKGLTLAQRAGVRTLGRVQDTLKDEAEELTERLDSAPAFALTLKKAQAQMEEAAKRLQSLKTDEDTQKAEQAAAKRVKQLIEALKPDSDNGAKPPGGGQPPGGGGQGGQGQRGGDGIGLASQLKVLKMLQEEVNERTEALDEIKTRKNELTPEQQAEMERLADDQRSIADIARDLTKPKKSDGEQ